jgi:hypothetical protein
MYTTIEMSSFVLIADSLVYYKFEAFHAVLATSYASGPRFMRLLYFSVTGYMTSSQPFRSPTHQLQILNAAQEFWLCQDSQEEI